MIMKLRDEARGDLVAWLDGAGGEAFRDFGIVFAVRYDSAGWVSVPWADPIDASYAAAFDAMPFETCLQYPELEATKKEND